VKQLIWVNRLSGATSLGNQRVVYYLGGVDNWLIRPNPHFDSSIDVDPGQSYGYQTLASPMRGFLQNSRNGNSFVAWNSELRFPVVSFLSKNPVKSELLRSIQLVAFMDVGTAWTGPHPYSEENYFNTQVFPGYPITVTLLNNREPIIMGFGTGIRVLLFGYFLKLDCGWGLNNGVVNARPRLQFSLGWDI
jgi:outer membrane protein assembly factor BamA